MNRPCTERSDFVEFASRATIWDYSRLNLAHWRHLFARHGMPTPVMAHLPLFADPRVIEDDEHGVDWAQLRRGETIDVAFIGASYMYT